MREIKFRGKTEAGEWIIGDLVNIDGDKYILADNEPDSIDRYKVITETIGQFTGLKDKNGVEIFEGDSVRCFNAFMHRVVECIVIFKDGRFCVEFPGLTFFNLSILYANFVEVI